MEDSFFGFDTSAPVEDDGGDQIAEPSEEEYDALNDETFGSAINGDWEEVHQNLVRLTGDMEEDGITLNREENMTSARNCSQPKMKNSSLQHLTDSDLEINLSGMKLDDLELYYGENENIGGFLGDTIEMDPSVWSLGIKDSPVGMSSANNSINRQSSNPKEFLRTHFPSPFKQPGETYNNDNQQQLPINQQTQKVVLGLNQSAQIAQQKQLKICTLEDIERSMIMQQSISKIACVDNKEENQLHQNEGDSLTKQHNVLHDIFKHSHDSPAPLPRRQQPLQHENPQQQNQQMLSHHHSLLLAQKGLPGPRVFLNTNLQPQARPSNNFANNLSHHPLGTLLQQQENINQPSPVFSPALLGAVCNRTPPGLYFQHGNPQIPPHPLLNQHGALSYNYPNQRTLPNTHLPVALNNFAMHPNFNPMRASARGMHPATILAQQQQAIPARMPCGYPQNPTPSNSSYNMFNMRLVQEIQQNHPLLQSGARQPQHHQQLVDRNHINNSNSQIQRNAFGPNSGNVCPVSGNQKPNLNMANGNLPHEEFDDYANLMSTREKHWLIGIQLSQLNTDTPYIDDYYFTVYKERKVALNGNLSHSQAHKDNQLNHPLTQPKGHAQLIMVQLGNKSGQRNGQHRERHNSENQNQNQDIKLPAYVFTPLKFENSLGKLQYGSVTAPRKIIDAEIMSNETSSIISATNIVSKNSSAQLAPSRSSSNCNSNGAFDIKAEPSTLLQMPNAAGEITSSNNQRKSRYILLHIETLFRILLKLEDLNNPNVIATILMKKKKESERNAALEQLENANKSTEERAADSSNNMTMKSKFNYDIETKDCLIEKLAAGLQYDKVVAMMNIRKGKVLIRRIMPNIENHDIRWNVWIAVFSSLQNVIKKDREDVEGVLYSLYPEFIKQIKSANFEIIVKICSAISLNGKKSNGVFCSKFGISSLVGLILQSENIYEANCDKTLTENNKNSWQEFLDQVASSLNRTMQSQSICAAIESDSIQPIMNHFARFKDLKLDSLLALITEAKQQID